MADLKFNATDLAVILESLGVYMQVLNEKELYKSALPFSEEELKGKTKNEKAYEKALELYSNIVEFIDDSLDKLEKEEDDIDLNINKSA